jgi:hypothetical protein
LPAGASLRFPFVTLALSLVLAVVVLLPTAGAAEPRTLVIDRPVKVGDTFDISGISNYKMEVVWLANRREVPQEREAAELRGDGVMRVIAIDAAGRPTKISVTVQRLSYNDGDMVKELLPAGATIEVEHGEPEEKVTSPGVTFDERAARLIADLFPVSDPTFPRDSQMYETGKPVREGDAWDVKTQEFDAYFEKRGDVLDAKGSGKVTFVTSNPNDPVPNDELKIELMVRGRIKPNSETEATEGQFRAELLGKVWVPYNPTEQPHRMIHQLRRKTIIEEKGVGRTELGTVIEVREEFFTELGVKAIP